MRYQITCKFCGTPFGSNFKHSKFCSDECRGKVRGQKGLAKYIPDRDFTPDTPFYCQKWYREGMSIKDIANALSRSEGSVIRALQTPLSANHQAIVERAHK